MKPISIENLTENDLLKRNPPDINVKLKNTRVAIAGLGGLGSNIAVLLARAGIGCLHLIDFDIVEISNLNRQHYRICHLGMKKADALKGQIEEINPFVTVIARCLRIDSTNAAALFGSDDIVCEAFDCPKAKAMLTESLLLSRPALPIIVSSGMSGTFSGNSIVTKRFSSNLYVCGDGSSLIEDGLISARVAICAAHQANMVLRLALGEKNP